MGNAVATELFAIAWTVRSSINNVPCYIKGSDCFGSSISAVAVTDAPGKNSNYIVPLVKWDNGTMYRTPVLEENFIALKDRLEHCRGLRHRTHARTNTHIRTKRTKISIC